MQSERRIIIEAGWANCFKTIPYLALGIEPRATCRSKLWIPMNAQSTETKVCVVTKSAHKKHPSLPPSKSYGIKQAMELIFPVQKFTPTYRTVFVLQLVRVAASHSSLFCISQIVLVPPC